LRDRGEEEDHPQDILI